MVCSIADNTPLKKLERELNIRPRCHGKRRECIQGFETSVGDFVLGLPGTALGYCQALFNNAGDPFTNTEQVLKFLKEIQAPWSHSHELFWGYRNDEMPAQYVEKGIKPLIGTGRVPILITGLDPRNDRTEIESIMSTCPAVPENETVLLRTILSDEESLDQITQIIRNQLQASRLSGKMPKWWPLLQGNLTAAEWERLEQKLGADWAYVNVATNPFVSHEAFQFLRDQITVAQIAVGSAVGILSDGTIELPKTMRLTGAPEQAVYSLPQYVQQLSELLLPPTLIVLGPSQPGWSDTQNQDRIAKLLPLLRKACDDLWKSLSANRRDEVWKMAA
jgi:hypothetical protein